MKKTSFILFLVVMTGCAGALKNKYTNFTAYYNTFYNAKKDFRAGLKKVEQQPVTLDLRQPIRVHPKTALAGTDAFNEAIDNGAEILRRFPTSKWTDDALLLLGKSYYYLQQDFLAVQKFEELLSLETATPLKQKAVIWKGRTLLDIQAYSRGVQFLQGALNDFKNQWDSQNKAETQILLAEHLMMLKQNDKAIKILEPALVHLKKGALKGRGYLLLGQLLQRNNDYDRAFQAYHQVRGNYPRYVYVYQADLLKAEVLRLNGKPKLAASIYAGMLKDDKNVNYQDKIDFNLAQIYQDLGRYKDAEAIYQKILSIPASGSPGNLTSNVYFQLGQIYSNEYHDFKLAAAYFDSSSAQSAQDIQNETQNGARKLASAYGRYVTLKNDIAHTDSLLVLGSLSESAFNARLAEIRQQRKETLQNSQNAVQQKNNILSNVNQKEVYQTRGPNTSAAKFGFLNYHNQDIVRRNHQKFVAIWGNRPLVDNWRRKQALANAALGDTRDSTQSPEAGRLRNQAFTDKQIGIDLNEIPRTPQSKQALKQKRLHAQYRLGSLFFLTLDQPDSAAFYYRRIVQQAAPSDLQAQALYSLYELHNLQGQPDSAAAYKQRIITQYADTRFAKRLLKNTDLDNLTDDSTAILREDVQRIVARSVPVDSSKKTADKLRRLAVKHQQDSLAPSIYYQAIFKYIEAAKQQDSLRAVDSLQIQPGDSLSHAYQGAAWDEVRGALHEFKKLFPAASKTGRVDIWLEALKNPGQLQKVATCKELDITPVIIPSQAEFVQSVSLPKKVRRMHLSGSIRYQFMIAKNGSVESYKLLSNPTHLGIEGAYAKAIENGLHFKPVTKDGNPVRASCKLSLPIKQ